MLEFALILLAFVFLLCSQIVGFIHNSILHPLIMHRKLNAQGLRGPPASFLAGNMQQIMKMRQLAVSEDLQVGDHDLVPRICPYYVEWAKIYGKRFVFWWGTEPRITITEPEMLKEILHNKSGHFGKSALQKKGGSLLLGNGLIMANGEEWAHRRRIVAKAFKMDKIKGMVDSMKMSTEEMLRQWDSKVKQNGGCAELDVYHHIAIVTSDIIVRTAFGSSYHDGIKLFDILTSIQRIFAQSNKFLWLPGSRFFPTTMNRKIKELNKEMEEALQSIVSTRKESGSYGNDLLGIMLSESEGEAKAGGFKLSTQELIEECKTFFFVGHETTLMLLSWTLMLLALHPERQDKARTEVVSICGTKQLDAELINKLKIVGAILNEAARLYPPAPNLVREAQKDMRVGDLTLPKGSTCWIPLIMLHHDAKLWGPDVLQFNPQRFADASGAKFPLKFLPFSVGPRVCVGQSFAVMEAKLILAMILGRFSLWISPNYRHSPVSSITLKPKYGVQLLITPGET